jgi:hypothetical protein
VTSPFILCCFSFLLITFQQRGCSYSSNLYVEDFTVAEISHDGDTTQCKAKEFQGTDKEQEGDEEKSINMQYDIENHQYISQTDGYEKLKEVKQGDTKFIYLFTR